MSKHNKENTVLKFNKHQNDIHSLFNVYQFFILILAI